MWAKGYENMAEANLHLGNTWHVNGSSTIKIWFGYSLVHKSFCRLKFKFLCVAFKAVHNFSSIYNTSPVLFPATPPHTHYLPTVLSSQNISNFFPRFIVSLFAIFSACNFVLPSHLGEYLFILEVTAKYKSLFCEVSPVPKQLPSCLSL